MDDLLTYLGSKNDMVYESVTVPEWDGRVIVVRSLTNSERTEWEQNSTKVVKKIVKGRTVTKTIPDLQLAKARLVMMAVCKGEGDPTRVFEKKHLQMLQTKNAAAVDRIFNAASRLSGYSNEDIEEEEGNSEATPNE